ncbi:MAG: sugar transferase [Candidatus Sungbacteria bacterium]|nr:sugar transferase [Candidatus Sungbacteria bacterium]
MGIQRRILKPIILCAGDAAVYFAALSLMIFIRYYGYPLGYFFEIHITPFSIIFTGWIINSYIAGLYELRTVKNTPTFYNRLYKVFLLNAAIAISVFYLLPYFQVAPRANLFVVIALSFFFIIWWRWTAQHIMAARGSSRVLFFGLSKEISWLADFLKQNPQLGYLPAAIMSGRGESAPEEIPLKIFSFNESLPRIIDGEGVELIVAGPDIKKNETLVQMLFQAVPLGIPVIDFLSFYEEVTGKIPVSLIGEVWFLENLVGVKSRSYEFFKRAIDLIIAGAIVIPSLLLFPFIALAIKFGSPGPVFYEQKRVGRGGKEFSLVKYRSMVKNAEQMDWRKGGGRDPRHTGIGAFLRKSYLDELPQVLNILRGEMSFVGPRPERPEFVRELKTKIPFYDIRMLVKPGITGWAQINMENDASVEDALEKLQYDLAYIKNRSVLLDITISLKTAATMLSRGGR